MKTLMALLTLTLTPCFAGDYDWQRDSDTFWQAYYAKELQNRYFQELDNQAYWNHINRQIWRNSRPYDDEPEWVDEE